LGPVFKFCAPRPISDGTEGVGSRFHVLRSRIHFRRYRGRRVPFSCFALPESISAEPRASGPVCICCAPGHYFDGAEDVTILTPFLWYRGRRVPFSCFALPDSFSAVPRASGPFFMFCAPGLVFGGAKCVGSCFHILLSRTRFLRCRRRRDPFSCFARPDSFSVVLRTTGRVFMFCALGLVFGCTDGVGSRFNVLRYRTHFRRIRGRRVPFSSFALSVSFSAVPSALGPVFMFCPPGLIFGGTKGVGSRFNVLRARTHFRR
jgi:hypothetical protein